ncbi:MAG: hypothetical protein LYZ66_01485 [Nitrososphaerales archaeon]|nr:hypothetical protein [Nitrososphaerales archaeon]
MAECRHSELEFVGDQKTDSGVNSYFKCRSCGDVVVVTPERTAFTLKRPS